MKNSGFTLIEVIIYIGLFSLLMSTLLAGMYQLVLHGESIKMRALAENDGQFVLEKIQRLLTSATGIASPLPGTAGQTLLTLQNGDEVSITHSMGQLQLQRNNAVIAILTSQSIPVAQFRVIRESPSTTLPDAVTVMFKLGEQAFKKTYHVLQ